MTIKQEGMQPEDSEMDKDKVKFREEEAEKKFMFKNNGDKLI